MRTLLGGIVICSSAQAFDGFDDVMGSYLNGAFPNTDPAQSGAAVPQTLSATGAFSHVGTLQPAPGLISYEVNSPLWSDGAVKKRWIAIPSDGNRNSASEQIEFRANEPWTFPVGTVAIKHFEMPNDESNPFSTERLETRFLVALGNNDFYGVTYRWRADGSEADLLSGGAVTNIAITKADGSTRQQQWDFPSSNDCRLCHNVGGGIFLGPNTWQLNGDFYYGESNTFENQLPRWAREGLFNQVIPQVQNLPAAVAIDDASATLEERSRSYLATNCANCHNDESTSDGSADFDLSFTNTLADTRIVNATPLYSLGLSNPAVVRAGAPHSSVLQARIDTVGGHRMPPIGRNVIDSEAVAVISDWILTVTDEDAGDGGSTGGGGSGGSTQDIAFTDSSHLLPDATSASGVAMGVTDMNDDGKDDIIRLKNTRDLSIDYQEAPNGNFSTKALGSVSVINQWGMAIGDADNNGYPDIISGGYFDGLHYYRANSNGTSYTQTNLPEPGVFLQAINFADIDSDGWLDIFACHDIGENVTFGNQGDGTMGYDSSLIDTRTTPSSDNSGNYGSVWTDYDGDGDLDLYIAKCRQGVTSKTDPRRVNQLFRNNGDGSYTEVAAAAGLADGAQSWTSDFADIDNDGDLDVFIGNHMAQSRLLVNNGNGTFTEITTASGIDVSWFVIQSVFRDFNNDGWVDLLLVGSQQQLWLNNGDSSFFLAENPFGANAIESCAVGDLNSDGFPDVYAGYAQLYNSPQTNRPDKLFLSQSNGNRFLSVRLKGVTSNRLASGARLELYGPWGVQVREVRTGEGYGVTHSSIQSFGLGGENGADRLIIRWPSGEVDSFSDLAANQFLTIEEGDSHVTTSSLAFGGTPLSLPGRVEAERFDLGGAGVSYFDTDSQNLGGQFRDTGVDIEQAGDVDGTHSIGWFDDGEWLHYEVEIPVGSYSISARVAAGQFNPGELRVLLNGEEVALLDAPDTGGPSHWVTVSSPLFSVSHGGVQTLRIEAVGNRVNLNWIDVLPAGSSPVPVVDPAELARALGSASGNSDEIPPILFNQVSSNGDLVSSFSFLTQRNGQSSSGQIETSEFIYRPECSLDLEDWTEPLILISNPQGTPSAPSGYEYQTFRLTQPRPRAFFRVALYK